MALVDVKVQWSLLVLSNLSFQQHWIQLILSSPWTTFLCYLLWYHITLNWFVILDLAFKRQNIPTLCLFISLCMYSFEVIPSISIDLNVTYVRWLTNVYYRPCPFPGILDSDIWLPAYPNECLVKAFQTKSGPNKTLILSLKLAFFSPISENGSRSLSCACPRPRCCPQLLSFTSQIQLISKCCGLPFVCISPSPVAPTVQAPFISCLDTAMVL